MPIERSHLAFIEAHSGPGDIFASPGIALELTTGRFQDEIAFLRAWCKESGQRFDEAVYWRIHAPEIEAYRTSTTGPRPKGAEPNPDKEWVWVYFHQELRDWIYERAERFGVWDIKRPLPHAFDTGIRVLEAAGHGPARSAGFIFDEDDLIQRYRAALKD